MCLTEIESFRERCDRLNLHVCLDYMVLYEYCTRTYTLSGGKFHQSSNLILQSQLQAAKIQIQLHITTPPPLH